MKKWASIKTRITIWYTTLMFILIVVVLSLVGGLSYQHSKNNIENDIRLQVIQIAEKVGARHSRDIFHQINSNEEFKNVSIYLENGEFVVGQYNYDLSMLRFGEGLRYEAVGGEEYIVYDVFKPSRPGDDRGYWIRGAESVNYAKTLGSSVFLTVLIIVPLILLLTALGGNYITKKAFAPINNITKTANDITTQKDITRRIEIEPDSNEDELYHLSTTLNKMLDKIENLIKQEKQFTSDASHELRTPISVILAQGEYLLDIANGEKEKELAHTIVDKATQVSKLVTQLLLLARIDQHRQKFNKEKVDLSVLADVAVDSMKEFASQKEILLLSNVPEGMIVDADESLLLSVITNLISNGIKYGRQSGYVSLSASRLGNKTEIIVADDGVGIDEEHIDKIWTRFYRVDNVRNDEYGSNGLGLSMVKSIIKLHGGEIAVKSEPDKGTSFIIML